MNNQEIKNWCTQFNSSPFLPISPLIMGIINLTPDSFYQGSRYSHKEQALKQAQKIIAAGVDIIDVGGESTRPGAPSISIQEELERVIPIIQLIRNHSDIAISIDTKKTAIMREAVEAGAGLINDISALQDKGSMELAAQFDCPICLLHMQGQPENMQNNPRYKDVITELNQFFTQRIAACEEAGIKKERLIIDPGFGFGKTVAHNLQLIQQLERFTVHQRPILLGVSRKNTIGQVLKKEPEERLIGSIVLTVLAAQKGLGIIRTHDVEETKQALQMRQAVLKSCEYMIN